MVCSSGCMRLKRQAADRGVVSATNIWPKGKKAAIAACLSTREHKYLCTPSAVDFLGIILDPREAGVSHVK